MFCTAGFEYSSASFRTADGLNLGGEDVVLEYRPAGDPVLVDVSTDDTVTIRLEMGYDNLCVGLVPSQPRDLSEGNGLQIRCLGSNIEKRVRVNSMARNCM